MSPLASFYPQAPPGIPADLARPSLRYRALVAVVLGALLLFLLLYLAFLAGALALMYWAVRLPVEGAGGPADGSGRAAFALLVRVSAFVVSARLFAFLFKRWALRGLFRGLHFAHLALSRQMEFNADLVAVSAAGSDAPVQALLKSGFCQGSLRQAGEDLALAAEQGLFSRDLYFHQDRAAEFLRSAQNDPDLGRPPALPADPSLRVQVFPPPPDRGAAKWSDHPTDYDREQNAKRRYWRSPQDERPAWLLFRDPAALREELTVDFYLELLGREPGESPAEPERVQAVIDEERAAGTFDPCYHGVYDGRYLELDDLDPAPPDDQAEGVRTPEGLAAALGELRSDRLGSWVAGHRRRGEELNLLNDVCAGQGPQEGGTFSFRGRDYATSKAETLLRKVQAEWEEDRRYLARYDASVFALHDHLAGQLGRQEELRRRYRFQLGLQKFLLTLWDQRAQLESVLRFVSSRGTVWGEEMGEIKGVLRQASGALAGVLREAAPLSPPPLKHVRADECLGQLLPAEPAVPEVPLAGEALELSYVEELHRQVTAVLDKLHRLHLKSLGGILAFQEQLVKDWDSTAGARPADG
jgi:hypothetical protein